MSMKTFDPGNLDADIVSKEIPAGTLPPLRQRDLPSPVPVRRMIGPSIILAGLALGSGEFVIWPYITYKSQFVFFWACLLGVATQYFVNMEIVRWTLATGESAITGFCRLNRHWSWVFLLLNIIPWMIPAWAKGAAQLVSWLIFGNETGSASGPYVTEIAIASMFLCGIVLTAGPIIYETVERVQSILVGSIVVLVLVLAVFLVRGDAVTALLNSAVTFGAPQFIPQTDEQLSVAMLLGALAFAGAGGTLNLGQSNYVKDKGYGMGAYIGRITSPITGREEPVSEFGYHFAHTADNLSRWRGWWRAASLEHFFSFFLTCLVCLTLLTLITYSIFYDPSGVPKPGAEQFSEGLAFVWGEKLAIDELIAPFAGVLFLLMGVAILLTTEFGVLDVISRISTDIIKVNWLQRSATWTESRLYYANLWGLILLGTMILLIGDSRVEGSFFLFKLVSALNGGVMFLYSITLLYLNRRMLPKDLRMSWWRMLIMFWSIAFFGFFTIWATWTALPRILETGS